MVLPVTGSERPAPRVRDGRLGSAAARFRGRVTPLGLALGLAIGTPILDSSPAAAVGSSQELVVPAAARAVPRATEILDAGSTGFLWAQEGDDRLLWTDYTSGATTALSTRLPSPVTYDTDSGYFHNQASLQAGWYGAGSDTVAFYSADPAPHVTLQLGAGTAGGVTDMPLPDGESYQGTFGDAVLSSSGGDNGSPVVFHLLRAARGSEDGPVTDTPVTGLPDGASNITVADGDAVSAILRYNLAAGSDGYPHWGIVDLATGALTSLPDRPVPGSAWTVSGFQLAADSIVRLRGTQQADLLDRHDPSVQLGSAGTSVFSYEAVFGTVGSSLLAVEPVWPGNGLYQGQPLWDVPLDGSRMQKVMDPAAHQIVQAPDGSVLVAGAASYVAQGDLDWGIYRISQSADGSLTRSRLTGVQPMPALVYGLSLGSGVLTAADNSTDYDPGTVMGAYRSTWLTTPGTDTAPSVVRTSVDGLVSGRDGDCYQATGRCMTMFASGTGLHGRRDATESGLTMAMVNGTAGWGPQINTGDSTPELADYSGRYALINGASSYLQYIGEFGTGTTGKVLWSRKQVAAAIWGSTLWSASTNGSAVTSVDIPSGRTLGSFTTPNGCTPNSLQAVGRWVYWTCVYPWGGVQSSGVYDSSTQRTMTGPAGQVLLGDGFLVHYVPDSGLEIVDMHGGLPASGAYTSLPNRVLVAAADLGSGTGARMGWTVDRFGGGVAYADDQQRIHIVPVDIPTSPLTAIDTSISFGSASWSGTWWTSKPVSSWTVTIRNRVSGATVRTISGGEARGLLTAAWDGKDAADRLAPDGFYSWTLTANPADGQGLPLSASGNVQVGSPLPAATAVSLTAPATATRASTLTISGHILSGAFGPGQVVHVTKTDPGHTGGVALRDAPLAADGTFEVTDTPQVGGVNTYTVSYPGDDSRKASRASATIQVSRSATAVSVTANASSYSYAATATVTAHLGTTYNGRTVSIYAQPYGGTNKLVRTGTVDSHGNLVTSYKLSRNTVFSAVFAGDYRYAPATATRSVYDQVKVAESLSGYYTSVHYGSTLYRVYHHTSREQVNVAVTPNKAGQCLLYRVQKYYGNAWHTLTTSPCHALTSTSTGYQRMTLTNAINGRFRVAAEYVHSAKDNTNPSTWGAWQYFAVRT